MSPSCSTTHPELSVKFSKLPTMPTPHLLAEHVLSRISTAFFLPVPLIPVTRCVHPFPSKKKMSLTFSSHYQGVRIRPESHVNKHPPGVDDLATAVAAIGRKLVHANVAILTDRRQGTAVGRKCRTASLLVVTLFVLAMKVWIAQC